MSALEEGEEEGFERESESRGKRKGKEGTREGGREEGRKPVAHDYQIAFSYSTSPVPLHRWTRVEGGSSSAWKYTSHFPSCTFFSSPSGFFSKLTAAEELIWERSEYGFFCLHVFKLNACCIEKNKQYSLVVSDTLGVFLIRAFSV